MTAPTPHLADLSAADRRRLESLLLKFEESWDEKRLPAALRQLPPDDPLRRPALLEMIKIDLERRRKAGQKVRLEAYAKSFPELGAAGDLPVDLLFAEYQVRRQFGATANLADYAERFPRRIDELRRRIDEADKERSGPKAAEGARDTVSGEQAKQPTSPPGGGAGAAPDLPEQFGRYRIVKRLGRGGMGSVYLAHDSQLDRQVALKTPHFTADDGPEVLERFTREARAAATIDHPNICPVYDVGSIDGVHFVTMAYIDGRPLSELVQEGKPLPQRAAAALVRKLAAALAEAHRHGVIHRDLKPGNVMVNRRKEPVVMDFGLARRVNKEDERLTRTGAVLGTPAYMPPEQVAGDVKAMGPACDVYSLGVMLYEMLTGQLPFRGPLTAVLGRILTQEPEAPSKLRPDLDPALEAVCLKAMAKKPADRFASMEEMADALGRYLKGEAVPIKARGAAGGKGQAAAAVKKGAPAEATQLTENLLARLVDRLESAPTPTAAAPPPPAHGAPWWVVPVVALLLVGGLAAAAFVVLPMLNRNQTITVNPNITNTNTNTVAVQLTGLAERLGDPTIVVLIDGKVFTKEQLAQAIPLTVGDHEVILKRGDTVLETRKITVNSAGEVQAPPGATPIPYGPGQPSGDIAKEPALLKGHSLAVNCLAFTPDSSLLISGSEDKTILLWDLAAGKDQQTLSSPDRVYSLALGRGGLLLSRGEDDAGCVVWDMATGKKKLALKTEEGVWHIENAAFSPDGRWAAVPYSSDLTIWDVSTGKYYTLHPNPRSLAFAADGRTLAVGATDVVRLVDVTTRHVRELKGQGGAIRAITYSPDGRTFASGGDDTTVRLWDAETGDLRPPLRGLSEGVRRVEFTPDGKVVAASDSKDALAVWDAATSQALPVTPQLPKAAAWALAADGKTLALASLDPDRNRYIVQLIDLYTGEKKLEFEEKKGLKVLCMACSPDGAWLAWGLDDGSRRLWKVGLGAVPAPARPEPPAPPAGEPSPAVKALLDALTDPDSNDVRRQAAESLKKLGDKTAVGPLEERIADDLFKDDPQQSGGGAASFSSKRAAVDALIELAPERVPAALVRAATQPKTEGVRVWACWALGTLKDRLKTKDGTEGLIAALKNDKSAAVRAEAVRALATGRHSAVPALADALFDPTNEVRFEAANTLRALGDRSANRPADVKLVIDGAVPALEKRVADDLFKDDPAPRGGGSASYSSKSAAVDALKELAPERVTPALLKALTHDRDEDVDLRVWACWELGKQDDKESLDGLAAAAKADKSPKVREAAVKAITERNK